MSGGCSWLFQDRLNGGYAGYRGNSEPHCSTGKGWPTLDLIFVALGALQVGAALAGSDEDFAGQPSRGTYILSGVLEVLVHGGSATSGFGWSRECRRAYADWDGEERSGSSNRDEEERKELARQFNTNTPTNDANQPVRTKPPLAAPRGFFCASNATVGSCAREKEACEATRGAMLAAAPDLTACMLAETAWCFHDGKRCAPTATLCGDQRTIELAANPDSSLAECAEAR